MFESKRIWAIAQAEGECRSFQLTSIMSIFLNQSQVERRSFLDAFALVLNIYQRDLAEAS